jgi:hypothetical protein
MSRRKDSTIILLTLIIAFILVSLLYSWFQTNASTEAAEDYDKTLSFNNRVYRMVL